MKLVAHAVEKPWGRSDLPAVFGGPWDQPIGEIWFEHPDGKDLPLLVKYIFTSEKLSVQVHPNDEQARERGFARGKNECWYILHAEEGATLGLGLRAPVNTKELRAAALDGSIEELMDWRPVSAGDFFYVPAGTIHAIGAGITLLEVQQNSDVTYRLYDYGRPRELHLDDGIAVAKPGKYNLSKIRPADGPTDVLLLDEPYFSLIRASSMQGIPPSFTLRQRWVVPLQGTACSGQEEALAGDCLLLQPGAPLTMSPTTTVLIAADASL